MPLSSPEAERIIRRVRALARLLDTSVQLPGTSFRFGLDPLLGLVPGVGDVASAALAVIIIDHARRLGAPRRLLARMTANVAADVAVGAVPVLGDVFDFAFRANTRNLRLLEDWLRSVRPEEGRRVIIVPEVLPGGG